MPTLTFYPLGNADCCRIELADGNQLLFDYAAMRDPNNEEDKRCDLPVELKRDMKKAKRDAFSVVAFTHLDSDHVKGAADFFYLEHAECYQKGDRYKIEEMWVPAAAIVEEGCEDDARTIRAEARHRLKKGNGIRVFSRPDVLKDWLAKEGLSLDSRRHLIVDAGQLVPTFNLVSHGVEFFVHSPFASRVNETEVIDRNLDSIVVQATFSVNAMLTKVMLTADMPLETIEQLVRITRFKKREDRLEWDVLKLPHHCSYLSIGPERGDDKTEPTEETKWLYEEKGLPRAIVVSTSCPIPLNGSDEDKGALPPHRQAYNFHKAHSDARNGRIDVTMQHPKVSLPEPLTIAIDGTKARVVQSALGGASVIVSRPAPRAGGSH